MLIYVDLSNMLQFTAFTPHYSNVCLPFVTKYMASAFKMAYFLVDQFIF